MNSSKTKSAAKPVMATGANKNSTIVTSMAGGTNAIKKSAILSKPKTVATNTEQAPHPTNH
jgi:hypothetical protein